MKGLIISIFVALPFFPFAQEHARILEHFTTYTVNENETAEIDQCLKIEIVSEEGHRLSIYEDYFDQFRKITDVTVDVVDRNGNRVKRLRRGDGVEFGLGPSYEITDGTSLIIDPEFRQYPFILEITSRVKLEGFVSLPTWVPRSQFNVSVVQSTLTVVRPNSIGIKFRAENIVGATKVVNDKTISTYKVSGLAHVENKMRYEDFFKQQPKVFVCPEKFKLDNSIGSNASWITFGDWFYSLNSRPYTLTRKTKDYIDQLGKDDKHKLIQNIYEFMQDRTRYVSIQLGIGGFKSLPTEDVENFGYGDCKALTTYMKNMLDYAGVKSNYILVYAGQDVPDVISDFPSNQFNHVFLGIPLANDTVYLECTSQISPTDYTGSFTDDRHVLWIESGKSSIIRSRVYDQGANRRNISIDILLDVTGDASANFQISNQGIFFDEVMIYKMANPDYIKKYNLSKFEYDDFDIKEFTYNQPSRAASFFESRFTLQIVGLAKVVSDKLVLSIVPSAPFHNYVDKDDLKAYFSVKRGISIFEVIEISIPENLWIYSLPASERVKSGFGDYSLSSSFDGQKLIIKREIMLYKGDYTKDNRYDEFKAFFQSVEKLEKRKLVLIGKT